MNYVLLIVLVGLSLVSFVANLVIFLYLSLTERRAPRFLSSLSELDRTKPGWSSRLDLPLLSIIVTARNEEEKIARCLSSLLAQTYPSFEILVIDDSSKDKTAQLAGEFEARTKGKVRLIPAGPKPPGWVGKSFPCWRGYEESRGEIILFVDADSTYNPETCKSCVMYLLAEKYDMFSISARVHLEGLWAHSIMPFLSGAINLFYPMIKVNDPKSGRAYVFGSFILVRKEVYEAIGGHRAIRDRIVEDAAIAENAKSKGYKLRVELGNGFSSTDWESELGSVYHGLERVFSHSVRNWGLVSALDAVIFFFLGLYPLFFLFLVVPFSLANISNVLYLGIGASVASVVLILLLTGFELHRTSGVPSLYPLLYPLGISIFIAAIITTSYKMSSGRGLEWKGISYEQKLVR